MFLVMMFSYNVKFLTCDESVQLKNGDFKSYKYETKKRVEETVYDSGKRSFCERRGGNWSAVNPRQIKQLEAKFRERTAVYCDWLSDNLIVIVFSSGAIAYLTVKPNTLDVTQILFDRYVVGKLAAQTVSGVAFCKSHLLFTHTDRTATLVTFGKNSSTQPCRIRDRDPHIQAVELGGSRRTERRVSWCETGSGPRVLVWGAAAVEPAPWSPVLEDHANMHLYLIKGQHMSLIAYHQLENETLSAEISKNNDNVIHIVEQTSCHKTGVSLEWVRYELPDVEVRATKLSCVRQASTAAALAAPARAVRRSPCDLRLLAACIDGSLHIVHATAGLTHSTRIGFVATEVLWAGALTLACEEGGRLQCLDRALAPLPHPAVCLHLAAHLREPRRMRLLAAHGARAGPLALAACGGPLALLRIAHPDLITAWIRSGRPSAAVSLLRSLDWAASGAECLRATTALVSRALRTMDADGEALAQAALGAYLAPIAPHAPNAAKYAPAVHDLARKFFHHLLRRGRVEKALSLCVDLRARDLCCDARAAARRARLPALADEARALAAHLANESVCSESCSQCSSHSSGSEEAPPLPRAPPLPAAPAPTTSIRPNLHQYLEKNNTIWNTDVREPQRPLALSKQNKHVDVPRQDEKSAVHFRHLFQTELREDAPNGMYRYHYGQASGERTVKFDNAYDRQRPPEKNKVKFSDTVTIAVVASEPPCPTPARELADSLPLCAPHKYLAAFARAPPGTADYVEV